MAEHEITGDQHDIGIEPVHLRDDPRQACGVHRRAADMDVAEQRDRRRRRPVWPVGQHHRHPANDRIGARAAIS